MGTDTSTVTEIQNYCNHFQQEQLLNPNHSSEPIERSCEIIMDQSSIIASEINQKGYMANVKKLASIIGNRVKDSQVQRKSLKILENLNDYQNVMEEQKVSYQKLL